MKIDSELEAVNSQMTLLESILMDYVKPFAALESASKEADRERVRKSFEKQKREAEEKVKREKEERERKLENERLERERKIREEKEAQERKAR